MLRLLQFTLSPAWDGVSRWVCTLPAIPYQFEVVAIRFAASISDANERRIFASFKYGGVIKTFESTSGYANAALPLVAVFSQNLPVSNPTTSDRSDYMLSLPIRFMLDSATQVSFGLELAASGDVLSECSIVISQELDESGAALLG